MFGPNGAIAPRAEPDREPGLEVAAFPDIRQEMRSRLFQRDLFDMTKIYVGNLPFSANEAQVRELFAAHGTVESVALINDRETGRPRGFGFVEMPRADAARAIQTLNGKDMGGRPLRVNEAQERPRGGGGGGDRGPRGPGGGGGRW